MDDDYDNIYLVQDRFGNLLQVWKNFEHLLGVKNHHHCIHHGRMVKMFRKTLSTKCIKLIRLKRNSSKLLGWVRICYFLDITGHFFYALKNIPTSKRKFCPISFVLTGLALFGQH
uniref:Uncharacterized protein n=1 Tax=Leersia perrieri TaxID=77586 RepID=A0A0D9XTG2_9ORYZ